MVENFVPGRREARVRTRVARREARGSDVMSVLIGGSLACASALFASYMLYSGPFKPGTEGFSLISLVRTRAPENVELVADPITTGSISSSAINRLDEIPAWFESPGRPIDYRLKGVVSQKAYVDISSGPDLFTWEVDRGGVMPGIGKVSEIRQEQGEWVLRTGRVRISQRGVELTPQE